jgi:hypothetical protein
MTSTAQLESNRANARLSTGPRTEAGKARSALNAVRHGLSARLPVSLSSGPFAEDELAVQSFIDRVVDDLAPATAQEQVEATRIAALHIRLHRLLGIEAAALSSSTRNTVGETIASLSDPYDHLDGRTPQEKLAARALDSSLLEKLPRYESHLSRELDRSLARYWSLQEMRAC